MMLWLTEAIVLVLRLLACQKHGRGGLLSLTIILRIMLLYYALLLV